MKALRTRCIGMLALAGLASACGSRSDAPQGTSEESYPPGSLGAPGSVSQTGAAQAVHTFSVAINGQPTACTDATTGMGAPFTGVTVMDRSNEGWGGDVQSGSSFGGDVDFDDILAKASTSTCGSP